MDPVEGLDLVERRRGGLRGPPDREVDDDRALDVLEPPPDLVAPFPQPARDLGDALGVAVAVPQVRVASDRRERLRPARAADEDGEVGLDRSRLEERVMEVIGRAVVRHALAIEQPADDPRRLLEPVQTLAEPGAEVEPERVVLALEPATA